MRPRDRIELECARRGRNPVVAGCVRLVLREEVDVRLILVLGGPTAEHLLATDFRDDLRYWLRVWGMRGLLWQWDDSACPAVRAGLHDEAWRVREMTAKVVARHHLGDFLEQVACLRVDPMHRVRAAAHRAVTVMTRAGA